MNSHKIILFNLLFWFVNTTLFACFCPTFGFCEVLTESSYVVEAKVVKVYYPTNTNRYYIDIEIIDYLVKPDTLSFDTLTIADNQSNCDWLYLEDMVERGDQFVFMYEQLRSDVNARHPSFSMTNCDVQYLSINGGAVTGLFVTESSLEKQTIDYTSFKKNVTGICNEFLTSFSSAPLNFNLNIFPNPAEEILNVKTNAIEGGSYLIYSHTGKIVKPKQGFQGDQFDIDISDFSTGIYYLQIKIEGMLFNKKIIKI